MESNDARYKSRVDVFTREQRVISIRCCSSFVVEQEGMPVFRTGGMEIQRFDSLERDIRNRSG